MKKGRFFVAWLIVILNITMGYSQNSMDKLDVIFKHDFENNTLGYYNYSEWYEDFNNPEWSNRQETLKILQDTEDEVNDSKVLHITYPANSLGPEQGGTQWWTFFEGQDEIYMSYDFKFMPGFQFQLGGKLPSFQAGYCPGEPTGYDGFTGGLMFNSYGNLVFYIYYPDTKLSSYGEIFAWGVPSYPEDYFAPSQVQYVWGIGEATYLDPGKWHNVTYRMVANSVPSEGHGNYDGILEAYYDGKLVSQIDHFLFRQTNDLKIDRIRMVTFFGGNTDDWRNPIEEWYEVDNIMMYNFKSDTVVPRGNVLSPTNRTINYWRNFGNAIEDPSSAIEPEPEPVDTIPGSEGVIKVNFIQSADYNGSSKWNNLTTHTYGTTYDLKNEAGGSTDVDLYVNSTDIYTTIYGAYPGIYQDEVMRSCWRADDSTTQSIQVKNLEIGKKYKIEIFGSNISQDYPTSYTVSGVEKSLNIYQNTTNTVSWIIQPSSSTIDLSWHGSTGPYGYLNSLIISDAASDDIVDVVETPTETPSENSKPVIENQTLNVSEVSYDAPIIGTVIASDPDEGQLLTFSILSGNNDNLFKINTSTGVISTNNDAIFSYSTLDYALIVKVEDDDSDKKSNQATITIHLIPDPKTFYIDPTHKDDVSADGSLEHPFESWADVTWKDGYKYYQKRSTVSTEDKISVYAEGVTIGAYGDGNYPVIMSSAKDYAIQALDKEKLTVTNIHLIADDAISGIYLLGNANSEYSILNCIIENSDYGVRAIDGKQINFNYNTLRNCTRGIYTYASENNIFYNIFKNNSSALEIASLTSTTNVYNNVFYENGSGVSTSHGDLTMYNNIFYLANAGDIALNLNLDKFLSDNNIFFPEQSGFIEISHKTYENLKDYISDYGLDLKSFCSDPLFVDVYNDNFAVKPGSPAINAGKILGLEKDFYGVSVPFAGKPDIGVSEALFSNITTAIKSTAEETENLDIYPNPSNGLVNIKISKNLMKNDQGSVVKICDQAGKTVYSKEIGTSDSDMFESVDLRSMDNGLYYIVYQTVDKIITNKLVLFQ